jgi:hypothetical protein
MITELFMGWTDLISQWFSIKLLASLFISTAIGIFITDLISRYFQTRLENTSSVRSIFTVFIPIWIGILITGILIIVSN